MRRYVLEDRLYNLIYHKLKKCNRTNFVSCSCHKVSCLQKTKIKIVFRRRVVPICRPEKILNYRKGKPLKMFHVRHKERPSRVQNDNCAIIIVPRAIDWVQESKKFKSYDRLAQSSDGEEVSGVSSPMMRILHHTIGGKKENMLLRQRWTVVSDRIFLYKNKSINIKL